MITTHEFDIRKDCWGGAEDRIKELTDDQIDELESVLEDYFIDADNLPSDTDVNDFIWFEKDTWKEWIGLGETDEDEDFYDEDEDEDFEDFEEFDEEEFED